MKHTSILLAALCFAITSCAKDPSENVSAARVQPAQPEGSKQATKPSKPQESPAPKNVAQAKDGIPLTGEIIFVGSKVTGSHANRFNQWTGQAHLDAKGMLKGLNITVQTAGIEADFEAPTRWSGKLEEHLRDDDFFASKRFPTAEFKMTTVQVIPPRADGSNHELKGQLTLRGITKDIQFFATIGAGPRFEATTVFSINRKDFDMKYDGKKDNLIRDNVVLKIKLQAAP